MIPYNTLNAIIIVARVRILVPIASDPKHLTISFHFNWKRKPLLHCRRLLLSTLFAVFIFFCFFLSFHFANFYITSYLSMPTCMQTRTNYCFVIYCVSSVEWVLFRFFYNSLCVFVWGLGERCVCVFCQKNRILTLKDTPKCCFSRCFCLLSSSVTAINLRSTHFFLSPPNSECLILILSSHSWILSPLIEYLHTNNPWRWIHWQHC